MLSLRKAYQHLSFRHYDKCLNFCSQRHNSNLTPRRALMYVPGDDIRKISKIKELKADCVVLDCEDGVAISKKEQAREEIHTFLNGNFSKGRSEIAVRLNSIESGLFQQDLSRIVSGKTLPSTLVLPKVNSIADTKFFTDCLKKCVKRNKLMTPIKLIFLSESCRSILKLPEICESFGEQSKESGLFEPVGIIFGSDDFCASLGATRTESSEEILYARQRLVLVAKAYDLQAIDMVHIDFKDLEGLKKRSEEGARLGYTGKQIIHPSQIDIVHEAFLPSQEKIKWATQLLKEFENFQNDGKGAFVFKRQMIDMPTVKQAKNILDVIKKIEN